MNNLTCEYCKNFNSIGATLDNPYPEIYCSVNYIDLYGSDLESCKNFKLSDIGKRLIQKERKRKLKRILNIKENKKMSENDNFDLFFD